MRFYAVIALMTLMTCGGYYRCRIDAGAERVRRTLLDRPISSPRPGEAPLARIEADRKLLHQLEHEFPMLFPRT